MASMFTPTIDLKFLFAGQIPDKKIQAEYIWLGCTSTDIRSKTRTLDSSKFNATLPTPDEIPEWNYDGSSTEQAPGDASEVIIKPRRVYPNPFRSCGSVIVLCDTYTPDGKPLETNSRFGANAIFEKALEEKPWFGLEQEYTIFQEDGVTPHGWPKGQNFPRPQGPYYCGVGHINTQARLVSEAHYRACLEAGLSISGTNAEVMLGQWEYQIGPVEGIDAGDQLIVSRYLLHRVGEVCGVVISLDPKPIAGDWNGAGCHTNYSTHAMRSEGGYEVIIKAIERLSAAHEDHIAVYGVGNERRLTGLHETASMDTFSYGVADRGASIRIPSTTYADKCGYLEDRRPASNCDPYIVTSKIFETTVL